MAKARLPERASLEFLKKLAKERLRELRKKNQASKLSAAQLAVARDHGFKSWRELKAEVDRRRAPSADPVFTACQSGDVATLRALLDASPELVHARRHGMAPLHAAVAHAGCVRLLLERGADPNVRDAGDGSPARFHVQAGHADALRLGP